MMVRRARVIALAVATTLTAVLVAGIASPAAASAPTTPVQLAPAREGIDYAADHVLVGLRPGTTVRELDELRQACESLDNGPLSPSDLITCTKTDGVLVDDNDLTPVVTLPLAAGAHVANAIAELQDAEIVETVTPDEALDLMDDGPAPSLHERLSLATQALAPTTVNDPRAADQWAIGAANLPRAWSLTRCDGSGGATVGDKNLALAILDTGVLASHEDLAPNLIAQYDAYHAIAGGGPIDEAVDRSGHGTHVCGIAGAATNNGIGVAGASYNAKVVAIKASDDTGHYTKSFRRHLIRAMSYILERAGELDIRVINFSAGQQYLFNPYNWGGDEFCKRITQARRNGILFVAAAGNQTTDAVVPYWEWPGDYDDCLSVINATRTSGGYARADTSNYNRPGIERGTPNETKDITAPGASILNTYHMEPWYATKSGTSMAAPLVAGIAALCFAEDPTLTPDDVQGLLQSTANAAAVGQSGWTRGYGYGMVDAYAAVSHIMSNVTVADNPTQALGTQAPCEPDVNATNASGEQLVAGRDYIVTYSDNDRLGTATATITGTGSYVGSVTKDFMIDLPHDVTGASAIYDGHDHRIVVTPASDDVTVAYSGDGGSTYTLDQAPALRDAGTMTVPYRLTRGDQVAYGHAAITVAPRQVTLMSGSASKAYDGHALTASRVDVGCMGWADGEGATTVTRGSQVDAGRCANAIDCTLWPNTRAGNYAIARNEGTLTVTYSPQVMYRLYNPNTGEHFYTANRAERDNVRAAGWSYEGHAWTAPALSPTPVWRLYNANAGDHHYTASAHERDSLVRVGWKSEGVGWYSGGPTRVMRQYNPYATTGTHNYSASAHERDALVALGWVDEGIAWYGM